MIIQDWKKAAELLVALDTMSHHCPVGKDWSPHASQLLRSKDLQLKITVVMNLIAPLFDQIEIENSLFLDRENNWKTYLWYS